MMSYPSLRICSFWRYVLNNAMYLLNLVSFKYVPKTSVKLWLGQNPCMRYIHICCCPAHVLKGKYDKLEPKTEVCLFFGYFKGTRGGLFYSPKDRKVFVSTNVIFLEDDYVNNFKSKDRVVPKEMLVCKFLEFFWR